jgi:type II secretory pathway component GspD/PulD (secretin)
MTDHRALPPLVILGLCALLGATGTVGAEPFAGTGPSLPIRGATSSQGNGVELSDAIRAYARMMRLPAVFIDPGVPKRTVRYSATNLDPKSIFEELLRTNSLSSYESDGVLHVAPAQTIALRYYGNMERIMVRHGTPTAIMPVLRALTDDRVAFFPDDTDHLLYAFGPPEEINEARVIATQNLTSEQSDIYPLQHSLAAKDIIAQLDLTDTSGSVKALPDTNSIEITGDADYIAATKREIALHDVDASQVFYTISIVEIIPKTESVSRGITLGPLVIGQAGAGASGSTNSTLGTNATPLLSGGAISIGQYSASLDALMSDGEARILKRINVAATNGNTASAEFGNEEPIVVNNQVGFSELRTVTAGVTLSIKPLIGRSSVSSDVKTTYTEITGQAANGYPEVAKRSDEETINTRDGESILIAGLYEDDSLKTVSENPPFSYIPIVGGLFHHRNESHTHGEILIIATPNIQTDTLRGPQFEFPAIDTKYRSGIRPTPKDGATAEPFEFATPTPRPIRAKPTPAPIPPPRPAPTPTPDTLTPMEATQ